VTTAVTGVVAGVVAGAASYLPGDTDAIVLLETDHRRLERLLKRAEETIEGSVKERREVLAAITNELTVHELIEEQVLYPALKEHPETRDIVLEGYQEHHVADVLVNELHGLDPADERWSAKLKVFKENIEHHIEEEEGPMFRTARGVMSRDKLQELGKTMAEMKQKAQRR
jgi:hemerythrin-like domain-containing protein